MASLGAVPTVCALVAGPCEAWVDTGTANAMQFLGWTNNGVSITEDAFTSPIHDDTAGGDQGQPTDYQLFGGQHKITCELVRFVDAVLALLEARMNPTTPTLGNGMLLGCQNLGIRVLLYSRTGGGFIRNYEQVGGGAGKGNCFILDPIERSPIGTQASRARITFTANHSAGVSPWNTTTTTP